MEVHVVSPALAVLATLLWLAEGRAGIVATAVLQKPQEASAVIDGQLCTPTPDV